MCSKMSNDEQLYKVAIKHFLLLGMRLLVRKSCKLCCNRGSTGEAHALSTLYRSSSSSWKTGLRLKLHLSNNYVPKILHSNSLGTETNISKTKVTKMKLVAFTRQLKHLDYAFPACPDTT